MKLSKTILAILTATIVAAGFISSPAQAVPISGTIGFGGNVTMNGTALTATQVNSFPNFIVVNSDGDFANAGAVFGSAVSTTVGVASPWIFSPPPGNTVVGLWSVAGFTFDLGSTLAVTRDPVTKALDVMGEGTISGNNFDPTAGTWHFTTQDPANNQGLFSFSAAINVVPDGGSTVALLGATLIAIGALRAKFAKA